jgi:hypothetical protein
MIQITKPQAIAARQILVEECGLRADDGRDGFVWTISDPHQDCREYRFMGALGFGGKFRNNGNRNDTPHVDCYREDETPERLAMIERANARLAELFRG